MMAPPWGLSTPTAPKELLQKNRKVFWSRNRHLSYGFAPYSACAKLYTFSMVPACALAPLGPQNALKTKIYIGVFPPSCFSFWEPLGLWFHGATVGPCCVSRRQGWPAGTHRQLQPQCLCKPLSCESAKYNRTFGFDGGASACGSVAAAVPGHISPYT